MKKILFLMALVLGSATANAQITTGENTAKVIRTGNRAQKGNLGIYLGATTNMFKDIVDSKVNIKALPLINLKYMYTDKTEFRLGLELWEKDSTYIAPNKTDATKSESNIMFYPGIAYHFSNKNLLDVYVGGELPFGWGSQSNIEATDEGSIISTTGYTYADNQKYFRVGVGAFIGLQAYLGNLPVALGCEYGLSALYARCYNGSLDKDGYKIDESSQYNYNASNSKFKIGHQVRLTLSYYFNR